MRRLALLVALLVFAPAPRAQTPVPQTPSQQPVFRGSTNVVRVDVDVTDRQGRHVTDLRKEDFHVFEDNIPQTVQTVKLIDATGAAPDTDESLPIRSPQHAAQEAAKDDIRVFVIFWDEYHVAPFQSTIRAREILTEFARTAFGPTDLVALMDQLTPTDDIRFSRDRTELLNQIHDLRGRERVYIPARSALEEGQLCGSCDTEVLRSQVTASALESTISYLGALKEGRKSILLVSETIGRLGSGLGDSDLWAQKVITLANTNNTTIYTLDPRGLSMTARPSLVLQSIAENTGGRQFATNWPAADMKQIVADQSAYYLLGYASSQNPADGKFHRIKVKIDRPGVAVKARSGYLAPTLAEIESATKPVGSAPPEVSRALEAVVDAPRLPTGGDLWVGSAPGADGTPQLTIVWTPNAAAPASGDRFGRARVSSVDGRVLFDGPLVDGHAAIAGATGIVHVRHDTLDADGGVGFRTDTTVSVPDFAHEPLSMSSPALYLARTPHELRDLLANSNPLPYAGRRFTKTDRVLIRFALFGADALTTTATAALLSHTGATLAALPMTSNQGRYQLDLPLGSIAHGDYVIAIDALHGADHARALVPIKAVPE